MIVAPLKSCACCTVTYQTLSNVTQQSSVRKQQQPVQPLEPLEPPVALEQQLLEQQPLKQQLPKLQPPKQQPHEQPHGQRDQPSLKNQRIAIWPVKSADIVNILID